MSTLFNKHKKLFLLSLHLYQLNMEEMFAFLAQLRDITWNDEDKTKLPALYTERMVHIALERAAVDKDWVSFEYILNKDKNLLAEHIKRTTNDLDCWDAARAQFKWLDQWLRVVEFNAVARSYSDSD